jgi:hypothetical protein
MKFLLSEEDRDRLQAPRKEILYSSYFFIILMDSEGPEFTHMLNIHETDVFIHLGPHLRTPNPGFNPGFTPAFVIYEGGETPG